MTSMDDHPTIRSFAENRGGTRKSLRVTRSGDEKPVKGIKLYGSEVRERLWVFQKDDSGALRRLNSVSVGHQERSAHSETTSQ